MNYELARRAFTLVEVLIVVAILGILGAIVLPEVQGYTQKAKENAAKDNLRILREAISRYAADHNDIPPGYVEDNSSGSVSAVWFKSQLENGYLSEIPKNPFNDSSLIMVYPNNYPIPSTEIGGPGWLYKPATKTIILNTTEYMDY